MEQATLDLRLNLLTPPFLPEAYGLGYTTYLVWDRKCIVYPDPKSDDYMSEDLLLLRQSVLLILCPIMHRVCMARVNHWHIIDSWQLACILLCHFTNFQVHRLGVRRGIWTNRSLHCELQSAFHPKSLVPSRTPSHLLDAEVDLDKLSSELLCSSSNLFIARESFLSLALSLVLAYNSIKIANL